MDKNSNYSNTQNNNSNKNANNNANKNANNNSSKNANQKEGTSNPGFLFLKPCYLKPKKIHN